MGNSNFLKETAEIRVSLPLAGMAIPCLLRETGRMQSGRKERLSKKMPGQSRHYVPYFRRAISSPGDI
ncbi:hypothetical protein GCM10027288_49540 [Bordetella tumbae]